MEIRTERPADRDEIGRLLEVAFPTDDEAKLVDRLRSSPAFSDDRAFVMIDGETIVGYLLFTTVHIPGTDRPNAYLTLAPVAVRPSHQANGLGTRLIRHGLRRTRELGFRGVVLHGSTDYYPRFEFVQASRYGLDNPFDLPDEDFMALELVSGAFSGVDGEVRYPAVFAEI